MLWYLIHTKPAGERDAQVNLERQGYSVYFPQILDTFRHRGRWRERVAALFPRYLFVGVDELQSLQPVHSTVGVASVVRFGLRCAVVPEQVIRALRSRVDPGSGLHRLTRGIRLTPGTVVRVIKGPFAGLEGVFEREAGIERVVVLLELLGQAAAVRVPIEFVSRPSHSAEGARRC